jgi:hypothetical protein
MTNNGVASTFNYDALGRETVSDFGQGITLSNTFNADQDWSVVDAPTVGHMERNFDEQNRLAGWKTVNGATPGVKGSPIRAFVHRKNVVRPENV